MDSGGRTFYVICKFLLTILGSLLNLSIRPEQLTYPVSFTIDPEKNIGSFNPTSTSGPTIPSYKGNHKSTGGAGSRP